MPGYFQGLIAPIPHTSLMRFSYSMGHSSSKQGNSFSEDEFTKSMYYTVDAMNHGGLVAIMTLT